MIADGPTATCRRPTHNNVIVLVHSNMQGARVGIIGNLGRMHTSVFSLAVSVKKCHNQQLATSQSGDQQPSRLFFISNKNTGTRFLVDTGAEVSVLPPAVINKRKPSAFALQAVNKSPISTYGE